jgi:predicted ATPase
VFRVERIQSPRFAVQFGSAWNADRNVISIITGPNGSGKTELLTSLASFFGGAQGSNDIEVIWHRTELETKFEGYPYNGPERVIAQTFSPFSRFGPPAAESLVSLTDVYSDGQERINRYRVIGLHRRSRYIGGTLSRKTLEDGIFRLSESPTHTRALGAILQNLGFAEQIHFLYRPYPIFHKILHAQGLHKLRDFLNDLLAKGGYLGSTTLVREARTAGVDRLALLLSEALNLVSTRLSYGSLELFFNFSYAKASEDYAVMQALALFRRLKLIGLTRCYLRENNSNQGFDLANASSGQQQILSSIFGLAAELRDNSLILIDEPELSLHPTWQMGFIDFLEVVLNEYRGCHAIIATHSPLVVQKALDRKIEVVRLGRDRTVSEVNLKHISHEGASVEGALLDVFRTPVSGSIYLANEIVEIVAEGEGGDFAARQAAIARLNDLKSLYWVEGHAHDRRALHIIDEALALVTLPDEDVEDDNGLHTS